MTGRSLQPTSMINCSFRKLVVRQLALAVVCTFRDKLTPFFFSPRYLRNHCCRGKWWSDLLPRALAGFLSSHGAIWRALLDNASHACIAAASWAVVVLISPSPPLFFLSTPGSPLLRCIAWAIPRIGGPPRVSARLPTTDRSGDVERGFLPKSPPNAGLKGAEGACGGRAAMAREMAYTACFASALDMDHFLAAGSLRLSRATSLAERPWGHCVAFLVLAAFVANILTRNKRVATSALLAGASHQLRDATRRGLWLYPPRGPKTHPLSYPAYLLAQSLLPIASALWLRWNVSGWFHPFLQGRRWRRQPYSSDCGESPGRDWHSSSMASP